MPNQNIKYFRHAYYNFSVYSKKQKDEKKPEVYAKDPHELTHAIDALRYYCIYWTHGASNKKNTKKRKWRPDQWEDYRNASTKDREYLRKIWGDPE